jgi:trans-2,3-dihydro-3-hydroxyanthranilate isomerase
MSPQPFPQALATPSDGLRFFIADVFTAVALAGNQLGVFPDARGLSGEGMQALAKELNFAESVFVLPAEADGDVRIRIFTPASEMPFAGHPTLGSAVLLGELLGVEEIRLETGVGTVPVALTKGDGPAFGRMQQPIPTSHAFAGGAELLAALGVARAALAPEEYRNGPAFVYVGIEDEAALAALTPDMAALKRLAAGVYCFAGAGRRWTARLFAPGVGVDEDPATGSAAGPLAVHLARHGLIAWGDEIEISQGARIGRPSTLFARATGSAEGVERVEVGGHAIVVASGSFRVLPS